MAINIIGYGLKSLANPSTAVTLSSGQFAVLPSGQYLVMPGKYTFFQWYDPVSLTWRNFQGPLNQNTYIISSDGYNYRLANMTGCVVGGVVTNAGTANTAKNGIWPAGSSSTPGVTATTTVGAQSSSPVGTATFNCIVGGMINSTVTVTAGGSGYLIPPLITFSPPPAGGLLATGYCLLTAGAVSSVVLTQQGAGYTSAPTITVTPVANDPGTGAVLTPTLDTTTSGKLIAVTMASNGAGYASVPTVTMAGLTSAAVTAVTCLSVVTAPTLSSATHYGNIVNQLVYVGQPTTATEASGLKNPAFSTNIFQVRNGLGVPGTSASLASQVIYDGGLSQLDVANLPSVIWSSDGTIPAAFTSASGASGGALGDQSFVVPI